MELDAARKRRPDASCGVLSVDRLSALPDWVIHHIMSFMKARQVVQTCVLSTRWAHLWRSVPSLDIDEEEFKAADANRDTSSEEWEKFENFADHLLTNNISISHLDTFRLNVTRNSMYCYGRGEVAVRWISHGVKYSALAPGIQREGLIYRSWRLRKLHLSHVILNDDFGKHVTSWYQYLEDLELNGCSCRFREIISHTLKSLVLKKCCGSQLSVITSSTLKSLVIDGSNNAHPLVITAPALACLLLLAMSDYSVCSGISIKLMPSLVKASIDIEIDNWTEKGTLGSNYREFLNGLTNVITLELSGFKAMVDPDVEPVKFPIFKNLKSLLLDKCDLSNNFQLLGHFLHNSPNLEKLTVRYCTLPKKYTRRKKGEVDLKKTSSQFHYPRLKSTEIIYKDGDNILDMLSALLSISDYVPKNTITLAKI